MLRLSILSIFWILTSVQVMEAADSPELVAARDAASHEDWDKVVSTLAPYLQASPGDEKGWSLMGDAQLALGDTGAAVTNYEKALSLDPKHAQTVLELTNLYLKLDKLADADRIVSAAEEKDKKGKLDEIKVARGQIYAEQDSMGEATARLASATNRNPKNPLYPKILARIYADQEVWPLAEQHYARAWELAPGDPAIAFEYGLVLQEEKKYQEALDLFKLVQEKDPNNRTVDYMIGRLYYAARRFGEAATQFSKSTEKQPEHFLSWLLLGKSYLEFSKAEKRNFYVNAETAFRGALKLKPERDDIRFLLAEAMYSNGKAQLGLAIADTVNGNPAKYDSAIAIMQESARLDTGIVGVYGQIARGFDKKGNLDSARVYAEREFRRNPADMTELSRYVNILQRQGRHKEMSEVLDPMMTDSTVMKKFGLVAVNALIESRNYTRASDLALQIVKMDPSNCNAHQVRAYVYLKREDYGGAIGPLQEGVKHCDKEPDLWLTLGDAYYFSDPKSKSRVTQARDAYKRAAALGSRQAREKAEQVEQILPTLK